MNNINKELLKRIDFELENNSKIVEKIFPLIDQDKEHGNELIL